METGVLFADLRGFTARTEAADPEEASILLRRFYRCAEDVLFPDAIIDKLIGDEVMALYLPDVQLKMEREEVPSLMLEHAGRLLRAVGYGSGTKPFVEMGDRDRSRARRSWATSANGPSTTSPPSAMSSIPPHGCRAGRPGGEIMLSERVADGLPTPVGSRDELALKGKSERQVAYRVKV